MLSSGVDSVISANEGLEDISCRDLLIVVVDAYLAHQLMSKSSFNSRQDRLQCLQEVMKACVRFNRMLVQLELAKESQLQLDYGKLIASSSLDSQEVYKYQKSRDEKVSQFKRQRELRSLLETSYFNRIRKSSADEQNAITVEILDDDELRRLHLLLIEEARFIVDDCLPMARMEYHMLSQAPPPLPNSDKTGTFGGENDEDSKLNEVRRTSLLDKQGPLLDRKGIVQRPFTITSKQEQTNSVFRPGHRLPSLSIDEYLRREFERGNVIMPSAGDKDGKNADEDNDKDENDENVYKQRQWDDFKDENPRGWGNMNVNRG